ncbi:MAG: heme NO-binding domain-containing protein [Aquabacterium sp.]|nr:heme NO-binding domain-containing protein [Aquabacterium sp.]
MTAILWSAPGRSTMYGLVNRAIEQLVIAHRGEDGWARVCKKADWSDEGFVAMQTYDDAVTYRLVGAVSEELGLHASEVLKAFGEYWILYTAEEGYGAMLSMCGNNIKDFLTGMNQMHARIAVTMPNIRPPHFTIKEVGENELNLIYESDRDGLAPMVEGLISGLAKRFGQRISIELIQAKSREAPKDVFRILILD